MLISEIKKGQIYEIDYIKHKGSMLYIFFVTRLARNWVTMKRISLEFRENACTIGETNIHVTDKYEDRNRLNELKLLDRDRYYMIFSKIFKDKK